MSEQVLIERNALVEEIRLMANRSFSGETAPSSLNGFEVCGLIFRAPVVDAVVVTRCKDCKYCDSESLHCDHPMGTSLLISRRPDDFCSYGERKETKLHGCKEDD